MNCTSNYIAFLQIIASNPSTFVPPSSVPYLRTTHFFTFSTFPVVPATCFANGMTTQRWQPSESRVCLCRLPLCLYTFFDLLNLFRPFWEMFSERQDNTVTHASHMGKYMLRPQESETLQTFTFPLLLEKQKPSAIFQAGGNIPIPSHVFPFLFIVQEDIVLIHDAPFFFLHVCAFASVVGPFLRNMAHISLRYISTIHSAPLFCYTIHNISIRFRRSPSRATPGNPASILYIKKNVCMFVSLYLIQIHISEPIGTKLYTRLPRGLEEPVGYVWAHNISPFPPFRPILSEALADSCAVHGCRRHTAPLQRYIRGAASAGVTSGTVGCAMKTRRSERNACV